MPGTALFTILPPEYVFATASIAWSVTLNTFKMNHVRQIIMLNAFEGGFSAIAYVGAHFIHGSWYKKKGLGKIAAVFVCFGHLGSTAGLIIIPGLQRHRVAWFLTDILACHPDEINDVFPLWMKSRRYSSRWQCSFAIGLKFILGSTILITNPNHDRVHEQLRFCLCDLVALDLYPLTDAPNYWKGYVASIVTASLILLLFFIIAYRENRGIANRPWRRDLEDDEEEEGPGNSDPGIVEQNAPRNL
ncbi:unnamed protein product [Diplocarpon coronariae]